MNKVIGFAALVMIVVLPGVTLADTLFTTPVIVVSPSTLKFGGGGSRQMLTNTFLVENVGRGKLIGKATVKAPFKIVDGGSYFLHPNETQVITVTYSPNGTQGVTNVVKFTGGGGAQATAIGLTGRTNRPAAEAHKP